MGINTPLGSSANYWDNWDIPGFDAANFDPTKGAPAGYKPAEGTLIST